MKHISLLGMIFLPGTFLAVSFDVAGTLDTISYTAPSRHTYSSCKVRVSHGIQSLFSMTFFNWPLYDSNVVSPYITVYLGLTTALTTITVVWWRRKMVEDGKRGMEELYKQVVESDAESVSTSSADGYSEKV